MRGFFTTFFTGRYSLFFTDEGGGQFTPESLDLFCRNKQFRNRIGEEGIELILKESIAVNEEHREDDNKPAFTDSTVQEKYDFGEQSVHCQILG